MIGCTFIYLYYISSFREKKSIICNVDMSDFCCLAKIVFENWYQNDYLDSRYKLKNHLPQISVSTIFFIYIKLGEKFKKQYLFLHTYVCIMS